MRVVRLRAQMHLLQVVRLQAQLEDQEPEQLHLEVQLHPEVCQLHHHQVALQHEPQVQPPVRAFPQRLVVAISR